MPFIDAYPEPTTTPSDDVRLDLTFDILPTGLVDYSIYLPRLVVTDSPAAPIEIPVKNARWNDDSQSVSPTLTVELMDPRDKDYFTQTCTVDFGIGKRVGGSWDESSFQTLVVEGFVQRVEHTVEGQENNPTDRVTVTISTGDGQLLNTTSETGLIIYDSDALSLSPEDYKTILDQQGREYTPELMGVPGLTLGHLLNEVLVNRCGFDSYDTDLPAGDWPIQMYSVSMGERLWDSLAGLMGAYHPIPRISGNAIGLYDSTVVQPEGFPGPRQITVEDVTQISSSVERRMADAVRLQYLGLENNYDFTTFRYEYPKERSGNSLIEYERIYIQFWKIVSPSSNHLVREALNIENKTVSIGGAVVSETSDVFEFNASGEYNNRRKTVTQLYPTLPTNTPQLQLAYEEHEVFLYQAHPYRRRQTYLARRELSRNGLVINDWDNPNVYGNPAKQAAAVAFRSNNMAEGQTYSFEPIGTRIEIATPQPDGSSITRVIETDPVNPSHNLDYIEKRPGEIGMSGSSTSSDEMLVFGTDGVERSTDRILRLPIGELPLKYGIPLGRRVLKRAQNGEQTVNLFHIGYDRSLVKGQTVSAYGRDGEGFGNFVIAGVSVQVDSVGVIMTLTCEQMAGTADDISWIHSYARSIEAGEALEFTLPVYCINGKSLTIDPSSMADLTVEARHVETPALSYTDLEATPIDLSPWDGTTQSFQIRITAGSVTEIERRSFALITR